MASRYFRRIADIFADLRAEYEQLDGILTALAPAQWAQPSAAEGWLTGTGPLGARALAVLRNYAF